jgi:hypothetical protein
MNNIAFNETFENAIEIDGDINRYHNGTGYLDGATAIEIPDGEIHRAVDQEGRKVLLFGTILGTIVVFERYTNERTLVAHVPAGLQEWEVLLNLSSSVADGTVDALAGIGFVGSGGSAPSKIATAINALVKRVEHNKAWATT